MICRARLATRLCSRRYSTAVNPYSNFEKLRAYPFAFDQERAKGLLGIWAASICNKGLVGSVLARFIPGFQGNAFQPKRIVPVYFPAWIYDVELQADITLDDKERTALLQIRSGYFPGSNFRILSTSPLWDCEADQALTPGEVPKLSSNKTLPWSTGLVHQHGQEVSCLPYSIYPLTGLKALQLEEVDIGDLSCELDTVREKFTVFRPVLIPVYLAEYEAEALDGEKRSCTLFMDAVTSSSSVSAYRDPSSFRDDYETGLDEIGRSMGFLSRNDTDHFTFGDKRSYFDAAIPSVSPPRDIAKGLTRWVYQRMREPRTIEKIAEASVVEEDDSDPRIRAYDTEERAEVHVWMDVGAEEMMTKRILQRVQEQVSNVSTDADAPNHLKAPIEALEENAKSLEEKKAELQPAWWTEYLTQKEGKP